MKKSILCFALIGSLFTACQKDDNTPVPSAATSADASRNGSVQVAAVSPVPSSFVTNVLAEEYVGTQYGLSPEASNDLYMLTRRYKNRVCGVSLHVNDIMMTYQTGSNLRALSSSPTFPCGTINRAINNGALFLDSKDYASAVNSRLQRVMPCGLAISSTATGVSNASIDVHTGFSASMSGNFRVMTYLIEDRVTSLDPSFSQTNNLNSLPNSMFTNAGNPIRNYTHHNVLRRCISATNGDRINSINMVPGGEQIFSYRIDLPAHLSAGSTFKLVSFIIDGNTQEVMNVQQADLNSTKDWN